MTKQLHNTGKPNQICPKTHRCNQNGQGREACTFVTNNVLIKECVVIEKHLKLLKNYQDL